MAAALELEVTSTLTHWGFFLHCHVLGLGGEQIRQDCRAYAELGVRTKTSFFSKR